MVAKMEQLQVLFNTCAPWVVLWMYAANPGKLIPQHMVLNRAQFFLVPQHGDDHEGANDISPGALPQQAQEQNVSDGHDAQHIHRQEMWIRGTALYRLRTG